ncbi:MAG: hypothetical protein IPK98_14495 [Chloracidobacterium sp.]|nr:hypothetical protein [Chloracidobacterium sp.]
MATADLSAPVRLCGNIPLTKFHIAAKERHPWQCHQGQHPQKEEKTAVDADIYLM